ncbi:coiled-coil domain-containing protein 17 [Amia ocellicauda]|uniref:coiled-coil domain-containing protein 17 n=1 Tax=Amia ocellicauda TaxID=2972642 RepID=UPI003464289A
MSALGGFHCRSCNMAFRSPGLLETHRQRFCIGSEIGDPFVLNRGRAEGPWREAGPKRTNTPDFIKLRERGSEPQKARQWEERAGDRDGEIRGSLSDSLALRKLTDEFHKLRLSLEESLPSVPGWVQAEESRVPPREWEYNTRVREVSETHEQHLADIQARNLELEGQREEIRRRLSQLSAKDSGTAHIEAMLLELRAQEERNEWALQQLSEQIQALHGQQGTAAAPVQPGPPSPAPPEVRKDLSVSFEMLSFGDGPLSSQIRALRLAYMQAGGSDPVILAQMHDLQAEAHTLERTGPRAEHRGKKKKKAEPPPRALDSELQAVERENQRLEEDILRLQLQRERQRGEEEAVGLQEMQRDHVRQMAAVQTEIESLRRDLERGRDPPRGRAPPPPVPPPPPLPPPLPHYPPGGLGQPLPPPATERVQPPIGQHLLEPPEALSPAPYDPVAGFVLFYDFVLGLEPTLSMVRLVVGLYSGGQEMGRPTPLPAVYCEVGGGLPYVTTGHPGNIATLSVKQPVPRVHPSPSICLVVELQAAGGFDSYGQEVQRLVSRGWARLDLFDQHNRVQSGWWKVPFRTLPVRPALSTGQLNAVPQVGRAELYLRVVNARDGDMQSLANTDPGTASQYKYPAMVATRPVVHLENPAPRHAAFQPPANRYLSLLPPTDHVDPPPPMEGSNQR